MWNAGFKLILNGCCFGKECWEWNYCWASLFLLFRGVYSGWGITEAAAVGVAELRDKS